MSPGKCRLKGWELLPGSVLDALAIEDAKKHLSGEKGVGWKQEECSHHQT